MKYFPNRPLHNDITININSMQKMRYQRIEPLGDGAYGVVYLAKDKETGENIALKVFIYM